MTRVAFARRLERARERELERRRRRNDRRALLATFVLVACLALLVGFLTIAAYAPGAPGVVLASATVIIVGGGLAVALTAHRRVAGKPASIALLNTVVWTGVVALTLVMDWRLLVPLAATPATAQLILLVIATVREGRSGTAYAERERRRHASALAALSGGGALAALALGRVETMGVLIFYAGVFAASAVALRDAP